MPLLARRPSTLQHTRSVRDFYQQRASFTTWLLRRRSTIKCAGPCPCAVLCCLMERVGLPQQPCLACVALLCKLSPGSYRACRSFAQPHRAPLCFDLPCRRLSLSAERWEDDNQAAVLRLAVAGAVKRPCVLGRQEEWCCLCSLLCLHSCW